MSNLSLFRLFSIFFSLFVLNGCNYHSEKKPLGKSDITPSDELLKSVSFEEVKQKVFLPKCISCHGDSGGINLENYTLAQIHLDKINNATLIERRMPKAPFPPLTQEELLILSAWIKAGGPKNPQIGTPKPEEPPSVLLPFFSSIKKNIFDSKCLICHTPGGQAARVPLSTRNDLVNSPLEIVIPGNPDESGLILVLSENARKRMPPPESGISPVKANELEIIKEWILNDAKD